MNKKKILDLVIASVEREHEVLLEAARGAQQAATHEEAKPENDKDTRALEASYLARGQAKRVEELAEAITRLRFVELRDFANGDAADIGALVRMEVDGEIQSFSIFLLPVAGGTKVMWEHEEVRVVTPAAPLGRLIMGRREEDEFEATLGGQAREYVVHRVC